MPFLRYDAEAYDEMLGEIDPADLPPELPEQPSGEFEYETAEAQFNHQKLDPAPRLVLDKLLAMKATTFRVTYDGGHDEGFTHPAALFFGDRERPAEDVIRDLATPEFAALCRSTVAQHGGMYGNSAEIYCEAPDDQVAHYALDELAHALASRLLGDGFGTGEYELYGVFTADLLTGDITDDPSAGKPAEMG